jgi:hypothetical protein
MSGSCVAVTVGIALVAACRGSADIGVRPIGYDVKPWGIANGASRPLNLAVRDDVTWQTFWRSGPFGTGDSVPPVDFRRETVLAFAEGSTSASSDPLPQFRRARLIGDTLVVSVRRKENCDPGFEDIIFPMALGRVSRHDGPVVFDYEIVPCRDGQPIVRHRVVAG